MRIQLSEAGPSAKTEGFPTLSSAAMAPRLAVLTATWVGRNIGPLKARHFSSKQWWRVMSTGRGPVPLSMRFWLGSGLASVSGFATACAPLIHLLNKLVSEPPLGPNLFADIYPALLALEIGVAFLAVLPWLVGVALLRASFNRPRNAVGFAASFTGFGVLLGALIGLVFTYRSSHRFGLSAALVEMAVAASGIILLGVSILDPRVRKVSFVRRRFRYGAAQRIATLRQAAGSLRTLRSSETLLIVLGGAGGGYGLECLSPFREDRFYFWFSYGLFCMLVGTLLCILIMHRKKLRSEVKAEKMRDFAMVTCPVGLVECNRRMIKTVTAEECRQWVRAYGFRFASRKHPPRPNSRWRLVSQISELDCHRRELAQKTARSVTGSNCLLWLYTWPGRIEEGMPQMLALRARHGEMRSLAIGPGMIFPAEDAASSQLLVEYLSLLMHLNWEGFLYTEDRSIHFWYADEMIEITPSSATMKYEWKAFLRTIGRPSE